MKTRWQRWTAGAAGLALALTGLAAGAAAAEETAPVGSNATTAAPDEFPGYQGLVGDDGAAASATDDSTPKDEEFDDAASNPADAEDVPGETPDAAAAEAAEAAAVEAEIDLSLPAERAGDEVETLREAVATDGSARVIVTMRTALEAEAELSANALEAQRDRIDTSLDQLSATLDATGSSLEHELEVVPTAVYTVTDEGLDALLEDPDVAAITLDREMVAQLDVSTSVIQSDLLNAAGVLGDGYNGEPVGRYDVAIIDSGVDNQHNAFSGRILSQACYSALSDCPNGSTSQVGAGAGDNCTHSSDCDHGTHVGGIAAGASYPGGHEGVARGAGIVAINVASDSPTSSSWTAYFSDLDLALQRVLLLKGSSRPDLVSVNMSIGTAQTYPDAQCDGLLPSTNVLYGQLVSAGVAPVVAAGNSYDKTQMSLPGCVSNAIAIGATNDNDVPANFSNASQRLDFFAPGVGIEAPVPTTNNHGPKSGTSMASPHVTGAFALLRECVTYSTVGAVVTGLNASGQPVTDNGVTRDRIDVLDAATRTVNNNNFASPENLAGDGPIDDYDWNVCADAEAGEPGPASVANSIWWTWTPATTGTATISTNDGPTYATTFDTELTVFTGNSLGSLQTIAFDDDGGVGLRSQVVVPVNGGTTYRIRVDGYGTSNGELNLHVENGPPPSCWGQPATIVGTAGDDVITGTNGPDVVVSGDGNDNVYGAGGNDRICLGAGNDRGNGWSGNDSIWGGPGSDVVIGSTGNDFLLGNAGGGDTDDVGDAIYGNDGDDFIDGWVGNDNLRGGFGDDQYFGAAGSDWVRFEPAGPGVNADLLLGTASGQGNDTLSGVEHLEGSNAADRLRGDAGYNRIIGWGGNDLLVGRAGPDALFGKDGNDAVYGNYGNDVLSGGTGNDTVRGLNDHDRIWGNEGNDYLTGDHGNDRLDGGPQVDACHGGSWIDVGLACEVTTGIP